MVTPRKKVTDATKAKLPLPKGHPQRAKRKRKTDPLRKAFEEHRAQTDAPLTASDILAIREKASRAIELNETSGRTMQGFTPSPIAGQPLPANPPTEDAPTFEAVPFPSDWATALAEPHFDLTQEQVKAAFFTPCSSTTTSTAGYREPLYDTRPYPWDIRRWLSHKLTALAKWVSP